jgi:hypothetical protein
MAPHLVLEMPTRMSIASVILVFLALEGSILVTVVRIFSAFIKCL